MTENKRFVAIDNDIIKDTKNGGLYTNVYVADWLDVLITENEQLKQENEQLKKENYKLHKRLGDFEPFGRYIKEKTSKTSINDIIGWVKTDEPTNSVELKKELYK